MHEIITKIFLRNELDLVIIYGMDLGRNDSVHRSPRFAWFGFGNLSIDHNCLAAPLNYFPDKLICISLIVKVTGKVIRSEIIQVRWFCELNLPHTSPLPSVVVRELLAMLLF